jgi:hypothetical protein
LLLVLANIAHRKPEWMPVRALFLLLLLANLLFLAWSRWVAPSVPFPGTPTPSATGTRSIRLLRESPAAPAPPAAGPESGAAGASCVSAGPFLERVQAEAAAQRLKELGFESRLREAIDEVTVGQWVHVPHLATPEDAANALAALKAAGLADAAVVNDGSPGNTVSVGVFGDPARAAQAVEIARKAGFAAEVSDRTRPADVWWLDVDRRQNGSLPSIESLGPGTREPPLVLRACPAAAAPPG